MTRMRLAYLVSQYPAISHTFIRREIAALRRRGAEISTFSVRQPTEQDLSSPLNREEFERTWYILPARAFDLVRAHLRALWRNPGAYLCTLVEAYRHRVPGARAAIWSLFHFVEAILLASELERRDVAHVHSHFGNSGGTVGLLAARFLGISWSLTVHGSKAEFDYPAAPLLGEKVAAASFVSCVSHHGRSQLLRVSEPDHWSKVFVSRCGIELERVRSVEGKRPAAERQRILCVGRLVPEKAQVGLVEAFAQLVKEGHDAELTLIGEGPLRALLERRITALGVVDRCDVRGALSEENVLEELARAQVFALSSLIEGLPVVLMEAMALQVPVVAPRLSGIPELVRDGRTGFLYDPGDWAGLSECLARLLEDPALRARLAAEGRRVVEAEFDVDRAVEPLWERMRDVA